MNNTPKTTSSVKQGARKTTMGIALIVIIILIGLGIVWSNFGSQNVTLHGTVDSVSMEDKTIQMIQVKIGEDQYGNIERTEKTHTIQWDEDSEFLPNADNPQTKNEILAPLASIEVQGTQQLTDGLVLAQSIILKERAPYRQ